MAVRKSSKCLQQTNGQRNKVEVLLQAATAFLHLEIFPSVRNAHKYHDIKNMSGFYSHSQNSKVFQTAAVLLKQRLAVSQLSSLQRDTCVLFWAPPAEQSDPHKGAPSGRARKNEAPQSWWKESKNGKVVKLDRNAMRPRPRRRRLPLSGV